MRVVETIINGLIIMAVMVFILSLGFILLGLFVWSVINFTEITIVLLVLMVALGLGIELSSESSE